MKLVIGILFSLVLVSCGSSKKEPEPRKFKKPYEVVDAQYGVIPSWINEPQNWSKEKDVKDSKNFRYFVYETEPKNSRSIACKIAKANAVAGVAGEINQFIKESLGTSLQGAPNDMDQKMEEYVENTLAQETQSFVVGARTHRTYWEQRSYRTDLGAQRNYRGFTCAALVKISKENLKKAIARAQKKIDGEVSPELKSKVQSALDDAAKKFVNL